MENTSPNERSQEKQFGIVASTYAVASYDGESRVS